MKCAILAGGKGVRMLPLTKDRPKPLVLVNGRPFVYYLVNNIIKAGFDDIAMIVGYKGEMIKKWAEGEGSKITFIEQNEQKGTGHAIGLLKNWSKGEDFVVLMGDNLYSEIDIKELNKHDRFNYVGVVKGDSREFGEIIEEKGFLKKIREKPEKIESGLINVGAYKFKNEIYGEIDKLVPSKRGEYEITDALTSLGKIGKVKVIKFNDYWINFGNVEDVKTTEKFVKENFRKT